LKKTIESLQRNFYAAESDLIIFSDGPKMEEDIPRVRDVRKYLKTVKGFKTISIIKQETNVGLSKSIVGGIHKLLTTHDSIIVLEDDLTTSPYFLEFMNEALERYRDEDKVISIHGYIYPVQCSLPETFFIKGADCWGWATWGRAWKLFEPDEQKLLKELEDKGLCREFDFNGKYPYVQMLKDCISGRNNSWAIKWYASAFLQEKLTLYPGTSLVRNIGQDGTGTHSRKTQVFDCFVSENKIAVNKIDIIQNEKARKSFEKYFDAINPWYKRAARKFIQRIRNH